MPVGYEGREAYIQTPDGATRWTLRVSAFFSTTPYARHGDFRLAGRLSLAQEALSEGFRMERLDASRPEPETEDWRWQSRHAITTFEALDAAFALTDDEREGARRAIAEGFPLSITPYYASLADRADASCPIRRQC